MATNAEMRQHEVQQEEVSAERPKTQTTQTDDLPPNLNVPNSRASSDDTAIGDIEKGDVQRDGQQQDGHQPDEPPQRSKGKIAVIMFALMMAVFLAALDVTIITTALPTISEHFHSTAGYTWIGSAFLLANSASIPSWGKVSDIFGRKPMLLLANVIFLIGSLVAGLSNSIGMLIAARAIQGIGGGGLVILVNITIGDLFSLRSRGAFYGLIGAVWAIASAIGPVIGGAFTEKVTWRWCFYVNLPLDGCALLILFFFLDVKTPKTNILEGLKAIDWVGSFLVVGGTLMLLFGLQYGGVTYPWDSATVICLLVFGAVTFGLFFFWEYNYAKFPVMPMQLFDKVTNIGTLGVVFFHGFVFIAGSYYLPLYFQAILGATPILSGVYLLPTALSLAFTSIGTGVFIRKTGMFLPPMYFGMIMMVAGYGAFIDLSAHSGWGKIIGFQIIAGLGIGPIFQSPIIALQAHVNPRDIGTATATLGFVRQLATATSVVIGEVVFQNHMKKYSAQLTQVLGPQLAKQLGGGSAGANVDIIDGLSTSEKSVVREDFAKSLSTMWIMYCAFAAAGVFCVLFVRKKVLSRQHEETKTGK
ncbi:putative major facilitator superfamily transporter [Teratosphaeria nubilosa]|uniref:Efflux pump dotC n=1 Tax=Teratosphaeria nubilosa TaxID=161662 RepID=A0A6G1L2X8_9PEZI|nr:putative major facilitator superfamily transporter [Teratosphaeria nubilosa]